MSNIQKVYTTTLEAISGNDDVLAILDHKLAATSPERVADYIELATTNIADKIAKLKAYKAELSSIQKDEENRLEHIKEQCAVWLENEGVDKLEGLHVSSITINDTAPTVKLKVINESYWINLGYCKTTVDETAVKNFLLNTDIDYSEFATLETVHNANKIKVNKKR